MRPPSPTLVRSILRALLLTLLVACSSSPTETPPANATAVHAEPVRARPRHEVMAEKLFAAIRADGYDQLAQLFGPAWGELGDIARDSVHKLRARLKDEGIDLAKAKIVRVDRTGDGVDMVDVHFEVEGRTFRTHFSAMNTRDYPLLGVANWIKPE